MGFVKLRKDKNKYYGYWRDPLTGKQKSFAGTKSKRETEELLSIKEGKEKLKYRGVKFEEAPEDKKDTPLYFLKDTLELYYQEQLLFGKAKRTVKSYQGKFNIFKMFLNNKFNNITLEDLTPDLFTKYIAWRKEHKTTANGSNVTNNNPLIIASNTTINTDLKSFSPFFNWCKEKNYIKENPLSKVKRLKVHKKSIPPYYTETEIKILLDEAKKYDAGTKTRSNKNKFNLYTILIFTGMRVGEICNLKWENMDLENKIIHIRSNPEWSPKTGSSNRSIPYTEKAHEALLKLKEKYGHQKYVLINSRDNKYHTNKLIAEFNRFATNINLKKPGKAIHTTRYTYASLLAKKGVPLSDIRKLMGHSGESITQIYIHCSPEQLKNSVRKLENVDV